MADAWQSAWVEVVPDFSNFKDKANREMSPILSTAGDNAGRESGRKFTGSFLGGLVGIGAGIAAIGIGNLIGDAISTGIDQVQQSITIASGLSESVNALNVSFGDASEGVQALGQAAAGALGLSNLEFNNAAVRFSSFATTIAGSGGDVVGVLDDLTTRSADFASVFNLDVSQALGLFQSGLAGESEPLRQFGLDLSAASVNAFAYANGIAASGEQLTASEAVQARYGLLMEQTAKTAGDFSNTSDSLANSQRILAAEFENAQARLGMMLLPAITEFMNVASTQLMPILNQVIDEVGPILADAIRESAPAFKELIVAVAPLIPDLIKLAVSAIPPLIAVIQFLVPIIRDWAQTWRSAWDVLSAFFGFLAGNVTLEQFAEVVNSTQGTFANFGRIIASVSAAVSNGIRQFVSSAVAALRQFLGGVRTNFSAAVSFMASIPGRIRNFFAGVGSWLYNSGRSLIQGFVNGIRAMVGAVGDAIGGVLDFAAGFFPNSPAERGPFSGAGWRAIGRAGAAIMDEFEGGLRPVAVPLLPTGGLRGARLNPAAFGGGVPGGGIVINGGLSVNNPLAEPVSRSVVSGLRQMEVELAI